MKIFKEVFGYIFSTVVVFVYLSIIFRGDKIIADMFLIILYLLPIFLFFGEYLNKLLFTKPSQKVDDFKEIKRIKVIIPVCFTAIAFIMIFVQGYIIFDIWYWDLSITLISVWIFSFVIIIILNFFFSQKHCLIIIKGQTSSLQY